MADPTALPEGFFARPLTGRQLSDFAQCPRRFLLSQFVGDTEERRFVGAAAVLHQALRAAIVEFYRAGDGAPRAADRLRALFAEHFRGELCADAVEQAQTERRGVGMLEQFAQTWVCEHAFASDTDVRMEFEIDDQAFAASADLVFAEDAGVLAVRLTSRRQAPSGSELASQAGAQLLALAAAERLGPGPVSAAYYSLSARRMTPVELSPAQIEHARRDVVSRATRMRREACFEPRAGKHCRWCPVRGRCGVWQ